MRAVPEGFRYSSEHTWVSAQSPALVGIPVLVGITDYAQEALGDIIYVELPKVGDEIIQGQIFGELESTKSVSELYAPISGTVLAINDVAVNDPSLVNTDPYGAGWLLRVESTAPAPTSLLSPEAYKDLTT